MARYRKRFAPAAEASKALLCGTDWSPRVGVRGSRDVRRVAGAGGAHAHRRTFRRLIFRATMSRRSGAGGVKRLSRAGATLKDNASGVMLENALSRNATRCAFVRTRN